MKYLGQIIDDQDMVNKKYVDDAVAGGGGAVDSVNGQTGTVVLDADDVGALPDTYVAPVTSVNSKTGAVTLSMSDLYNDVGYITFGDIPVGTVYETTDGTLVPNSVFGGTWQLLGQFVTDGDAELTTSDGLLFADTVGIVQTYKWQRIS